MRLVEDVETKLNLAVKYKCHDVVIDVSLCWLCWERGWLLLLLFVLAGLSVGQMKGEHILSVLYTTLLV